MKKINLSISVMALIILGCTGVMPVKESQNLMSYSQIIWKIDPELTSPSIEKIIPKHDGDIKLNSQSSIGISKADDTYANIEVGRLLVRPKKSINEILDLYNAKIIDKEENTYLIEPDLDKISMNNFENYIQSENKNINKPISNITFSSVNTAKTIAAFMEIGIKHKDLIDGVSLNNLQEPQGLYSSPIDPESVKTMENSAEASPEKCWWLQATGITKAWKYSLGLGVKVGIVDMGWNFTNTDNGNYKDDDLEGRIVEKYNLEDTDKIEEITKTDDLILFSGSYHGTYIATILGAQIDNRYGIAGVAPRSEIFVAAMKNDNIFEIQRIRGIRAAIRAGCKVINVSLVRTWNRYDSLFADQSSRLCPSGWTCDKEHYNSLMMQEWEIVFNEAVKNKVILVFPAANDAVAGDDYFPQYASTDYQLKYGNTDPTICVGGLFKKSKYEVCENINPGAVFNANFQCSKASPPYESFDIDLWYDKPEPGNGSNYGDYIDIYAPCRDIKVKYANNKWVSIKGTSFASPIVAGVVTLLKSRNPDLTVTAISDILTKSAKRIPIHVHHKEKDGKIINDIHYVNILNAEDALKDPRAKTTEAKIYKGQLSSSLLKTSNEMLVLEPSYVANIYQELNGKNVQVMGWKNDNKIEVLQIRETNE